MAEQEKKFPHSPWRGWRPESGKKYNPDYPHFNPMHPPEGYLKEALEREWGENFDDEEEENNRD